MGHPTVHVMKPEAAAIERDIEHTRAEMGHTIDAIQRKLDPDVLKAKAREKLDELKEKATDKFEDAKAYAKSEVKEHIAEAKHAVREATVGRVEHMVQRAGHEVREMETTVVDRIRANPIPAAMIGTGLAWLLMSGKKKSGPQYHPARYLGEDIYEGDYSLGGYEYEREGRIDRAKHRVQHVAGDVVEKAGDLAHDARDVVASAAHRTKEGATDLAHTAGEGIQDAARFARTEARELGHRARAGARRVERGVENTYRTAPIGVGLAALALGTLAGLALPHTRREDALLGATRDKLVKKAETVAESALDRVSTVAHEKLDPEKADQPTT